VEGSRAEAERGSGLIVTGGALTDEDLVRNYLAEAGRAGAERWIDELFRRHHARVACWCYRFAGDWESAADLAQEVFMKAYKSLDSFRGDAKFSTWLYTIARSRCINELKARATRPETELEPILPHLPDTSGEDLHAAIERERARQLMRELMRTALDETEQKVLALHYSEELPLEAITRLLRLDNPSGAKAYVVSARRKLAAAFRSQQAEGRRIRRGVANEGMHG